MERESFVFYRSFFEAIRLMPTEVQTELYPVICDYALFGTVPDNLSPMAKAIFILMKPNIDTNTSRYENGKKGGRKKKKEEETPLTDVTEIQDTSDSTPPPAPTAYSASVEEEITQMKQDNDLRDDVCQDYDISAEEYDNRLSRFLRACKESTDKKKHDSYEDCKRHFRYWMDKAFPVTKKSPAPTTYNPSYDEECDLIKGDRAWIQQQCIQLNTTSSELNKLIDQFKFHCMKNKRRHNSLRDAQYHFQSWIQQSNYTTINAYSTQPKTQRRGHIPDVDPAKYYSDSF